MLELIRPIGTLGMCTTCHEDETAMEPELRAFTRVGLGYTKKFVRRSQTRW